jgi:hypothetical protein
MAVGEKRKKAKKAGRPRRITVRVGEVIGCEKAEFYRVVRDTMEKARQVINLCYTELRARDPLQPGEFVADPYIYPAVKHLNDGGYARQVSSLSRHCQSKYLKERFNYISGQKTIANCRNPVWPLLHNGNNKGMRLHDAGEYLTCEVNLVGGWYKFRIRGGSNYRDQIRGLRRALAAGAVCDSQLRYKKGNGVSVDIAVRLPEVERRVGLTVRVNTTSDALLCLSLPRSIKPFVISAMRARAVNGTYDRKMYQLRTARKFGESKSFISERVERVCEKRKNSNNDIVGTATRQVIDFCVRNGVAVIEYDDIVRSAVKSFPWFALKSALKYKAEDAGIDFIEVKHAATTTSVDLTKPHVYWIFDPSSERVKVGRSENFGKRLKTFLTSNPDWVCLAVENYKKGDEVAAEKHYLNRFDAWRVAGRGESGQEVFEAAPVLEFLRAAGWLANTGNRSQLMQIPSLERFMDGVGHLQADGDDEPGDIAG